MTKDLKVEWTKRSLGNAKNIRKYLFVKFTIEEVPGFYLVWVLAFEKDPADTCYFFHSVMNLLSRIILPVILNSNYGNSPEAGRSIQDLRTLS
tara:strand:- start:573 stop:851 length:279 start_codon:yes stop_codon:yes gene_type:complete